MIGFLLVWAVIATLAALVVRCGTDGPAQLELPDTAQVQQIDIETGEIVDAVVCDLSGRLEQAEEERDNLRRANEALRLEVSRLCRELDARTADLERFATVADLPDGAMQLTGRLLNLKSGGVVIVADGRPVRLTIVPGWEFPAEDGEAVSARAVLRGGRWTLWQLRRAPADVAEAMPALTADTIRKLKADKAAKGKASSFDSGEIPKEAVRLDSHNASAVQLHVVLVRKRRGAQAMTKPMADAWKDHVAQVIKENGFGDLIAIEVGSEPNPFDHLHFAVAKVPLSVSISHEIGRIKAISSGRVTRDYPELVQPFYSAGFFVGSAGGANLDAVKKYIESQND